MKQSAFIIYRLHADMSTFSLCLLYAYFPSIFQQCYKIYFDGYYNTDSRYSRYGYCDTYPQLHDDHLLALVVRKAIGLVYIDFLTVGVGHTNDQCGDVI